MPAKIDDNDWVLMPRYTVDENGCWIWQGSTCEDGYGKCGLRAGQTLAHRAYYFILKGPIPDGLEADHLCKNRACCNPEHIDIVTHTVNVRRGDRKENHPNRLKTHCKFGHEFSEKNTLYEYYGDRVQRKCRTCRKEYQKTRRETLAISVRDWPLRRAIFCALHPDIELREV